MKKRIKTVLTTAVAILSCSGVHSLATIYYVSQAGNDSNSGSDSTLPWHCSGMTGWYGSVTLKAGDTVYFRNSDLWEVSSGQSMVQVTGGVTYDGQLWGECRSALLIVLFLIAWRMIRPFQLLYVASMLMQTTL